jgi:hypothetical protein
MQLSLDLGVALTTRGRYYQPGKLTECLLHHRSSPGLSSVQCSLFFISCLQAVVNCARIFTTLAFIFFSGTCLQARKGLQRFATIEIDLCSFLWKPRRQKLSKRLWRRLKSSCRHRKRLLAAAVVAAVRLEGGGTAAAAAAAGPVPDMATAMVMTAVACGARSCGSEWSQSQASILLRKFVGRTTLS